MSGWPLVVTLPSQTRSNGISSVAVSIAGPNHVTRELNGIFLFTPYRVWCEQVTCNLFLFIVLFVTTILIS